MTIASMAKGKTCRMTRVKKVGMRCRCGNKFAKKSRCK